MAPDKPAPKGRGSPFQADSHPRPSLWTPLPTRAAEGSPEPLVRREHTAHTISRPRPAHPQPRSSRLCSAAQALEASRRLGIPPGLPSPGLCRAAPCTGHSLPPPPSCTLAWPRRSRPLECQFIRLGNQPPPPAPAERPGGRPAPAHGCPAPRPASAQASSASRALDPAGSVSSVARQEGPRPLPLSGHPAHCCYLDPKCPH